MTNEIKHIKAGIAIESPQELKYSVIGERVEDYENEFNDMFLGKILEVINHDNWGIWFKQFDERKSKFIVDIYVDDKNDWLKIANVIKNNLRENYVPLEIMPRYWGFSKYLEESK